MQKIGICGMVIACTSRIPAPCFHRSGVHRMELLCGVVWCHNRLAAGRASDCSSRNQVGLPLMQATFRNVVKMDYPGSRRAGLIRQDRRGVRTITRRINDMGW